MVNVHYGIALRCKENQNLQVNGKLKNIILSETTQTQIHKHHMFSLLCVLCSESSGMSKEPGVVYVSLNNIFQIIKIKIYCQETDFCLPFRVIL